MGKWLPRGPSCGHDGGHVLGHGYDKIQGWKIILRIYFLLWKNKDNDKHKKKLIHKKQR